MIQKKWIYTKIISNQVVVYSFMTCLCILIWCIHGCGHKSGPAEKDSDNIESLLKYGNSLNLNDRKDVITKLRFIGDPRAIPFIIDSVKSDNPSVRREALMAIADIPDTRAYDSVVKSLYDKNVDVQIKAIEAACSLSDQRFLEPFRELYSKDPKSDLKFVLMSALAAFS